MPGAERLRDSKELEALLRDQKQAGRLFSAICAAPAVVLEHHGLLEGQPATCHPAFVEKLSEKGCAPSKATLGPGCGIAALQAWAWHELCC
jgi:protein deglycase